MLPRRKSSNVRSDKAACVGHSLAVTLSKGPLQIGRFNLLASGLSEHFQGRLLSVIAAMMRPVRQPVVIADQFTMKVNRLLNRLAPFPVILAELWLEFRTEIRSGSATDGLSRTCE